tara:strand:+ start:241 stop:1419 length:1179 start_codon:yes stop_codon:yes gene_type:complete
MRVAFFIDSSSVGGGYYHMLNFVNLVKEIKLEKHSIVFITRNKKIFELLNKSGIKNYFFKPGLLSKISFKLLRSRFITKIFELINYHNPFYQFIKRNEIDYVVFNEPSYFTLYCEHLNFISYIFNTEIDDVKHFNEFKNGNYERQKRIVLFSVNYAKKIFVFTKTNKLDLIKRYNCDSSKILIQNLIPYLPEIYQNNIEVDYKKIFKTKFALPQNKKLLFYPAQFWEHKNHILIIDMIQHLKKNKFNEISIVFSGNDKGNFSKIKHIVEKEGLESYVNFLGEISELELIAMYKHCDYVIIPTFIGRCSLPLLESIFFKKIIFYNKDILDLSLLEYVIGIDPNNAEELFLKIKKNILDKNNQEIEIKNLTGVYEQLCNKKNFINNFQNLLKNM